MAISTKNIKRVLHAWMHAQGFDVVPYTGQYFASKRRVETMARLGVDVVLDVGANSGQFAAAVRRDGWNGDIVSLEPLQAVFAKLEAHALRDPRWIALNVAAGAEESQKAINVSANTASSSLLQIADHHTSVAPEAAYIGAETIMVRPLDALTTELRSRGVRFYLKADVQGYEHEVLSGATETLKQTAAVELELSITEMYEGQAVAADMIRKMLDEGFVPIALEPMLTSPAGEILQMDALFIAVSCNKRRS